MHFSNSIDGIAVLEEVKRMSNSILESDFVFSGSKWDVCLTSYVQTLYCLLARYLCGIPCKYVSVIDPEGEFRFGGAVPVPVGYPDDTTISLYPDRWFAICIRAPRRPNRGLPSTYPVEKFLITVFVRLFVRYLQFYQFAL